MHGKMYFRLNHWKGILEIKHLFLQSTASEEERNQIKTGLIYAGYEFRFIQQK